VSPVDKAPLMGSPLRSKISALAWLPAVARTAAAEVASGGVMLNGSTPVPISPTDKPQKSKLWEGVTLKGNNTKTSAL
jgi:hypothetical protein